VDGASGSAFFANIAGLLEEPLEDAGVNEVSGLSFVVYRSLHNLIPLLKGGIFFIQLLSTNMK
jgi:hypothetical protein